MSAEELAPRDDRARPLNNPSQSQTTSTTQSTSTETSSTETTSTGSTATGVTSTGVTTTGAASSNVAATSSDSTASTAGATSTASDNSVSDGLTTPLATDSAQTISTTDLAGKSTTTAASNVVGSTLSTSTLPATGSTALSASLNGASASTTSIPQTGADPSLAVPNHSYQNGISSGGIAAAVVVPLLLLLLIVIAVLLFRRRKRAGQNANPAFMPAMKEMLNPGNTRSQPPTSMATSAPLAMSGNNNAYFTGLDTGPESAYEQNDEFSSPSHGSEGAFAVEYPPPYDNNGINGNSVATGPPISAVEASAAASILLAPSINDRSESRQSDTTFSTAPASPIVFDTPRLGPTLLGPTSAIARQSISRSGTERSITSTLYSDTASLHSARAARMSLAGANVIGTEGGDQDGGEMADDPFEDPESPISSVGEDTRSLNDGGPSSVVSPVSQRLRPWDRWRGN